MPRVREAVCSPREVVGGHVLVLAFFDDCVVGLEKLERQSGPASRSRGPSVREPSFFSTSRPGRRSSPCRPRRDGACLRPPRSDAHHRLLRPSARRVKCVISGERHPRPAGLQLARRASRAVTVTVRKLVAVVSTATAHVAGRAPRRLPASCCSPGGARDAALPLVVAGIGRSLDPPSRRREPRRTL